MCCIICAYQRIYCGNCALGDNELELSWHETNCFGGSICSESQGWGGNQVWNKRMCCGNLRLEWENVLRQFTFGRRNGCDNQIWSARMCCGNFIWNESDLLGNHLNSCTLSGRLANIELVMLCYCSKCAQRWEGTINKIAAAALVDEEYI
jgi:hypothetical protein